MRLLSRLSLALLAPAVLGAASPPSLPPPPMMGAPLGKEEPLVVATKNFSESRLLGEMFAQLIEDRLGLAVERKTLAGTKVCFDALRTGAVDLYPEYTGTALVDILGEEPLGGRAETLARVRAELLARWDLWWLAPLGFENAFELAVPREVAETLGLVTISDLARSAPSLRAGFGYEFVEREDGLRGLERVYGLRFREVRSLQQALKYEAVRERIIDCMDVYTTDGRLLAYDLVVLVDDLGFFPPYEAGALVRGDTLERTPQLARVLGLLGGAMSEEAVRGWNFRIEVEGESVAAVAADALAELGLLEEAADSGERVPGGSLLALLWRDRTKLTERTLEHLALVSISLLLAALVALPLGLVLERRRGVAEPFLRVLGVAQTIPSIALLAFMIPLLGIGARPAIAALWLYSLFPIARNTFTGVRDAAPEAVRAAGSLGMTDLQALLWVRLPLAAPTIMAGLRTASALSVGTATLAAFIGAGGLGVPIVSGLQSADTLLILSGALPAALLAVVLDLLLGLLERAVRPRGL